MRTFLVRLLYLMTLTAQRRGQTVRALKDRALLERAEADDRLILTLDKDFWQLALRRPIPIKRCGVILFRAFPASSENLESLVESALRAEHPWIGHVSVVTKDGIEMIATGGQ